MRDVRLFCGALLIVSAAASTALAGLDDGVGLGPRSILRMRFEVTFFKIDVADIEARIPPALAARIAPRVEAGESKETVRAISRELADADTLLIEMLYLRDADFDKFSKGILRQLEAARDSDRIDQAELDRMWADLEIQIEPLRDPGISEGTTLAYRVDGDRVRMRLTGP
ncbi:MAG: hypothetical protein GF346_00985, partial [Candidatus Eisenbacteria bacterium]|nr:hypothetical protein [Candidatus Latescibacterota bacterium]MBD3301007.1 hypothetical protein [Candidatus Eisenbacteria bacterium]